MKPIVRGGLWRLLRIFLRTASPDRGDQRDRQPHPARSESLETDGGARRESEDAAHLRAVPDGAGCTEIWEHLSERQAGSTDDHE